MLIWALIPYAWVRYNAYVLVAADRQHVDLIFNVSMTALSVVLNVILISRYGHLGAAIAMLATMIVYMTGQHVYLHRHLAGRAAPLRIEPAVFAGAAALAACLYIPGNFRPWPGLTLGMLLYGTALLFNPPFLREVRAQLRTRWAGKLSRWAGN